MNREIAVQIIDNYVCAACWGGLIGRAVSEQEWDVVCLDCGEGHGFIRKASADRMEKENLELAAEARYNLRDVFPNPLAGKTEEQILHELGF